MTRPWPKLSAKVGDKVVIIGNDDTTFDRVTHERVTRVGRRWVSTDSSRTFDVNSRRERPYNTHLILTPGEMTIYALRRDMETRLSRAVYGFGWISRLSMDDLKTILSIVERTPS